MRVKAIYHTSFTTLYRVNLARSEIYTLLLMRAHSQQGGAKSNPAAASRALSAVFSDLSCSKLS